MAVGKRSARSEYEELLASFYGGRPSRRHSHHARRTSYAAQPDAKPVRATSVSLAQDDGEVLETASAAIPQATVSPEYVVATPVPQLPDAAGLPVAPQMPETPLAAAAPPRDVVPVEPVAIATPAQPEPHDPQGSDVRPSVSLPAQFEGIRSAPVAALTDDELLADMQRILSGQASWDPETRQVTEGLSHVSPSPPRPQDPDQAPTAPPRPTEHAFFDQLAASMEYANAYDLGSIDMQQRFIEFDRVADLEEESRIPGPSPAHSPSAAADPARTGRSAESGSLGAVELLADMQSFQLAAQDSLEARPAAAADPKGPWSDVPGWSAACAPMSLAGDQTAGGVSRAMYDTGEHVLAGDDLYPDALHIGPGPGVAFSYGQVIALGGDLAGTPEELMAKPLGELTALKALIQRSTRYHLGGRADRSLDVGNSEWDAATHGNYLHLAERNYEHFAPHTLPVPFAGPFRFGNHRTAWEFYHRTAIEASQRNFLEKGAGEFPEAALIRNAFGDHFLTDAFASGHLFNKEVAIAEFRANFFGGGSKLKPAAAKFFERLAEKAFVGEVRKRFSALETADYPVCAWGWCLRWHPNINSVSRFTSLLRAAAEQEPEKIANMAVKALHDHLNRTGLLVTNVAGDGVSSPWRLQGDGYLNAQTKAIMQRAVKASCANITDPAIRASGLDVSEFQAKVWQYVPQLTPASQAEMVRLLREYTNPDSAPLVESAAKVLTANLDTLIKELLDQKKLKVA